MNKIDEQLSGLTTVVIYHKSVTESLDELIRELRELRSNLGEYFQNLRNQFKRNRVKIDREQIINGLSENVNAMNRITSKNMEEMAYKLKCGFEGFDEYQKRSLGLSGSKISTSSNKLIKTENNKKNNKTDK